MNTDLSKASNNNDYGVILEKVILESDLSKLSPIEKVQHVNRMCDSLGLNPITQPIQLIKFQGKEIPYMRKDGTEQLRKINAVSVFKMDKEVKNDIYIVTAYVKVPDGREDIGTGVVSLSGLKGDALCNAMMKAETKAKRRATLSICGLGFMDESELDTLNNAVKLNVYDETHTEEKPKQISQQEDKMMDELFNSFVSAMDNCKTLDDLKEVWDAINSSDMKKHAKYNAQLVKKKDDVKSNIIHSMNSASLES